MLAGSFPSAIAKPSTCQRRWKCGNYAIFIGLLSHTVRSSRKGSRLREEFEREFQPENDSPAGETLI